MTKKVSTLNTPADEQAYDTLRAASRIRKGTELVDNIRVARRRGWSYALIADALSMSPSGVRRIHVAWMDKNYA